MRGSTVQYLNGEIKTLSVRNANASQVFLDGYPVFLDYPSTTNTRVDSKSYNESGASVIAAGIFRAAYSSGLAVGEVGEAVCYGFTEAIVVRMTRTGSDVTSVASYPAIASGDQLIPVTDGLGGLSRQGTNAASNLGLAQFFAVQSAASATTLASASTLAATAVTSRIKIFARCM